MNSKITNKNIMNYNPDNKTVNYYKKILTIIGQNNLIFMRWFNSITIQKKIIILIILIYKIIIFYYLSVGLKRSNITPKEMKRRTVPEPSASKPEQNKTEVLKTTPHTPTTPDPPLK